MKSMGSDIKIFARILKIKTIMAAIVKMILILCLKF